MSPSIATAAALFVALGIPGAAHATANATAMTMCGVDASRLQKAIDDGRRASGAPGVSAAIMTYGELVSSVQSGSSEVLGKVPITRRTLFTLASISKMFVAAVAMRLVEERRLRLDGPIAP